MPTKRYYLRKSIVRKLVGELEEKFGPPAGSLLTNPVEVIELGRNIQVFVCGGTPVAFRSPEGIFPTLFSVASLPMKRVTVDMGAVRAVSRGADIMGPGVVGADEGISRGDVVVIVDEQHGKHLALGLTLADSSLLKGTRGRVIKNLHHVGDKIWSIYATLGKG